MLKILIFGALLLTISTDATAQDDDAWRAEAAARIGEHRMGPLTVEVVDGDGEPVAGARVHVQQTRHAFRFGTAVNRAMFAGPTSETDDAATYRAKVGELFNAAVLENGHKWRVWDKAGSRQETVATTNWLLDHGLHVRGHCLVWQHRNPKWSVPDDVTESDDPAYVRQRVAEHIREEITFTYGNHGRLDEWDMVNEPVTEHTLTDKLTPGVPKEEAPDLVDWFNLAHDAAPEVRLFINDFHILVGDFTGHRDSYEKTIRFLLDHDAPLGGIGFQGHYHGGNLTPPPTEVYDRLQRFAAFGVPLLVTEFDMFGKGWDEGQKQAWLSDFMTVCFSHPAVEGFYMWGFWDGRHWNDDAPLFTREWTLKPEGQAWMDLVYGDWWTDTTGTTDAAGRYTVRPFRGEHRVTVTGPDETTGEATATVTADDRPAVRVTLTATRPTE